MGTIYVGGRIALTSTGNVKWTYDLGVGVSPSYSLAIGADKTLYIAGKQDMTDVVRLYAITVPEPCTMLLMGVGLAGLVGVARRRKTKHHA